MIQKAVVDDLEIISQLAAKARARMQADGLMQWPGNYPDQKTFEKDISQGGLYVYKQGDRIVASISILPENDDAYKEIRWLKDHSLVIHRVVVDPDSQKQGIGLALFEFARTLAKTHHYLSIKVDTHPKNFKMQRLITKAGYVAVGYLPSINRLAYELVL